MRRTLFRVGLQAGILAGAVVLGGLVIHPRTATPAEAQKAPAIDLSDRAFEDSRGALDDLIRGLNEAMADRIPLPRRKPTPPKGDRLDAPPPEFDFIVPPDEPFFDVAAPQDNVPVPGNCGELEAMRKILAGRFSEKPAALGLTNGPEPHVMELYTATTGTWTLMATDPTGISCVLATGTYWSNVKPAGPVVPRVDS